jgi:hypothetical protein
MAGVRRNVATVSQAERDKLPRPILALDGMTYADGRTGSTWFLPPPSLHRARGQGITHGTVGHDGRVHDLAAREAKTATNALDRLAAKPPLPPRPTAPKTQEG